MNVKSFFLTIWKTFLIILLSAIIGMGALVIAFSLPIDRIIDNVSISMGETILREGAYPPIMGTIMDNYTEAMYLNETIVGGWGLSKYQALSGYVMDYGQEDPVDNLVSALDSRNYGGMWTAENKRFWNGYVVPLKILLQFMSYSEIRILIEYFIVATIILTCYLMYKRNLGKYIIAFILAVMFINPFSLSISLTFCGFYFCTIIPCIIILWKNEWLLKGNRYYYLFVITGISVIYFNMNYFQLISFGVPVVFYYLLNEEISAKECMKKIAFFFFGWFVGYAGMMTFKWILYVIFIDKRIIADLIWNIKFRLSSSNGDIQLSRTGALSKNIICSLQNKIWTAIEILFFLWCAIKFIKNHSGKKVSAKDGLMLFVAISLPVARCMLFANHMWIHSIFTYRLFMISVFMINVFLTKWGLIGNASKHEV